VVLEQVEHPVPGREHVVVGGENDQRELLALPQLSFKPGPILSGADDHIGPGSALGQQLVEPMRSEHPGKQASIEPGQCLMLLASLPLETRPASPSMVAGMGTDGLSSSSPYLS